MLGGAPVNVGMSGPRRMLRMRRRQVVWNLSSGRGCCFWVGAHGFAAPSRQGC